MSVTDWNEYSASGGYRGGHKEYRVEYRAITDDKNDEADVIWDYAVASQSIGPGTTYSYGNSTDPDAYLGKDRWAEPISVDESRKYWRINCMYTTDAEKQANQDEEDNPNPLDKPVIWSGSWINYQRAVTEDIKGVFYGSSAGEPFDPPKQVDDPRMTLRAEKNWAGPDFALWNSFRAKINSQPIWGLGQRELKVQSITPQQVLYQDGDYWKVVYEFEILDANTVDRLGWDEKAVDMGFWQFSVANNRMERITKPDSAGTEVPVPEPWLLDGTGAALTDADVKAGVTFRVPAAGFFQWYEAKDFSLLGLPAVIGV